MIYLTVDCRKAPIQHDSRHIDMAEVCLGNSYAPPIMYGLKDYLIMIFEKVVPIYHETHFLITFHSRCLQTVSTANYFFSVNMSMPLLKFIIVKTSLSLLYFLLTLWTIRLNSGIKMALIKDVWLHVYTWHCCSNLFTYPSPATSTCIQKKRRVSWLCEHRCMANGIFEPMTFHLAKNYDQLTNL